MVTGVAVGVVVEVIWGPVLVAGHLTARLPRQRGRRLVTQQPY